MPTPPTHPQFYTQLRSRPWLWLPPQLAHDLSPFFLNLIKSIPHNQDYKWNSFKWRGLYFKNPLGVAGGVDKNVQLVEAWSRLGAGFLEVGTITPLPQGPNPGKIIDRHIPSQSLWNKMGFPNRGLKSAVKELEKLKPHHYGPLFANIGKNRNTPESDSALDYIRCIQQLENYVDGFVINISSPNTKNLRNLFNPEILKPFLSQVLKSRNKNKPALLKLSPDVTDSELQDILSVSLDCQVDGWVFSNTTLSRENSSPAFPTEGGVSGKPLAPLAQKMLVKALAHIGDKKNDKLIISTGGIFSAQDITERLRLGAHLVQVYSALVFNGPYFFRNILKDLQNHNLKL